MRQATKEERESVDRYIKSIAHKTGITIEQISTFRTADGFYELKFSEAEMSDAFNGGFLDAIARVLEIIDEYEDLIIKGRATALSERTETVRAIRHAVNALSEDKKE